MCFLARRMLMGTVGHYVDDFVGVEMEDLADSGFTSFANAFVALGLRMKAAKTLPPSSRQKILGVLIEVSGDAVTLRRADCQAACHASQHSGAESVD